MTQYKNKVYLNAYPEVNLGDDLFIKIIIERYPNVLFYLEAKNIYKDNFRDYKNLSIISNKRSFFGRGIGALLKRFSFKLYEKYFYNYYFKKVCEPYLNNVDAFVTIGGSLFMQTTKSSHDYYLLFYSTVKNYLKDRSIPMFFLGCNFGPYKDNEYLARYTEIFSEAYDVSFREEYSASLFKSLPQVRVNSDIVFGYNVKEDIEKMHKSVGFSIVPAYKSTVDIDEESYISKYVEVISSFASKQYQVKLFSFSKNEGDEDVIEKIYSRINDNSHIAKVYYRGNIDAFIQEYRSVESVFCGRFHALILSMVFGQNVLPIAYSMKMINILRDINYTGKIIELKDFAAYDFVDIQKYLNNKFDLFLTKSSSGLHFEKLDELLNSCSKSDRK